MCVHTFPSRGAGVRRSGSLRWLAAGTRRRLPQIGPQQVTGDPCDTADGGYTLGRDHPPLRDGAPFDADFSSDEGAETLAGGGAQQGHSGEDSGHPDTLRGAKPVGKPQISQNSDYLLRETEPPTCDTVPVSVGEKIQAARAALGLAQQDVAKLLGVGRSAGNQWESDTTMPSITNRAQLAVLLKMPMSDLIPGMPVDEVIEALAQLVRAVPRSKREALMTVIQTVAATMSEPTPVDPPPRQTKPKRGK